MGGVQVFPFPPRPKDRANVRDPTHQSQKSGAGKSCVSEAKGQDTPPPRFLTVVYTRVNVPVST